MFALCIESSHLKGMGHLYRMINFAKYLQLQNKKFIFLINENQKIKDILISKDYNFEVVDLENHNNNWETGIACKYNIKYWINDRLNTNIIHAEKVKNYNIKLITFDDLGNGAKYSDINVCGLFFNRENLMGKKILKGIKYLILNDEINKYKRERTDIKNILVTLGGSDTYGVTVDVIRVLKKYDIKATIHIGPLFENFDELYREINENYLVIKETASLVKEFYKYDLAITGGGLTPFEANASGLPCLVVANENFEIPNAEFLDNIGSSIYIGYHNDINESIFRDLHSLNIEIMSKNGVKNFDANAAKRIYEEIQKI